MTEEWRPIPRFPAYEASSLGRIRRVAQFYGHPPGRVLKQVVAQRSGYYKLTLIGPDGRRHHVNVHTVICETFHGPKPPGTQCAHGDGTRTNNVPSNLRWATPQENQFDRVAHGTDLRGEQVATAVLTLVAAKEIKRRRNGGERCTDIAKDFGVSPSTVSKIAAGINWRHA